jgi:hypothetical protein
MHWWWRSLRRSYNWIMLTNVCRQRRVPGNLDKSLETGENCHNRKKFEDRDMLISMLSS